MPITEAQWLTGNDLFHMRLEVVKESRRKTRLFSVACCRRIPAEFLTENCLLALDAAEAVADGRAPDVERKKFESRLRRLHDQLLPAAQKADDRRNYRSRAYKAYQAASACFVTVGQDVFRVNLAADLVRDAVADKDEELRHQCDLLRDIHGNPFHRVGFHADWRTADVVALARSIYDDRAFDKLPKLARALKKAGCDNADILAHCRSDGPHVRGCWVVDLVLAKE
jgi:hypothetical protein